ncbi:response regulator [Deinococcus aquaticus]
MNALILIVEDEPQLAEVLEAYARQEGYRTERAADGNAALHAFRALNPDLILLDIMLPGRSGLDVLRTVRGDGATPVILVTARAEETDQIVGLELGADDYVVKPFRPREVMARVRAVLRRAGATPDDTERPVRVGPLEVDRRGFVARVDGEVLNLTPAEFRLLSQLAESPGRAFSREELLAAALPDSDALERVVDAHRPACAANWKLRTPAACCTPCAAWATAWKPARDPLPHGRAPHLRAPLGVAAHPPPAGRHAAAGDAAGGGRVGGQRAGVLEPGRAATGGPPARGHQARHARAAGGPATRRGDRPDAARAGNPYRDDRGPLPGTRSEQPGRERHRETPDRRERPGRAGPPAARTAGPAARSVEPLAGFRAGHTAQPRAGGSARRDGRSAAGVAAGAADRAAGIGGVARGVPAGRR